MCVEYYKAYIHFLETIGIFYLATNASIYLGKNMPFTCFDTICVVQKKEKVFEIFAIRVVVPLLFYWQTIVD